MADTHHDVPRVLAYSRTTADPVDPEIHSMGADLNNYVTSKVHKYLREHDEFDTVYVMGNHRRPDQLGVEATDEKKGKIFNTFRPTGQLLSDSRCFVIYCFPGTDYVRHYALLISTYFKLHPKDHKVTVEYELPHPIAARSLFQISNLHHMGPVDHVVVGLVEHLKFFPNESCEWKEGPTASPNNLFRWRVANYKGMRIAFLGCMVSFWGNSSADLVKALIETYSFISLIYVGKSGTIDENVIPYGNLITGKRSFLNGKWVEWENVLENAAKAQSKEVLFGDHYNVPTPLIETKDWVEDTKDKARWVDCEIGWMAKTCRAFGPSFGYIHYASDNAASKQFQFGLTNERDTQVKEKRSHLLIQVDSLLKDYFDSVAPRLQLAADSQSQDGSPPES